MSIIEKTSTNMESDPTETYIHTCKYCKLGDTKWTCYVCEITYSGRHFHYTNHKNKELNFCSSMCAGSYRQEENRILEEIEEEKRKNTRILRRAQPYGSGQVH